MGGAGQSGRDPPRDRRGASAREPGRPPGNVRRLPLRWQHVHPSTRGEGPAFVETVLQQLQGYAMPARLWESEVLPRRVEGYRPAWLDEVLNRGSWLLAGRVGRESSDERKPATVSRASPSSSGISRVRPKAASELGDLSADEARVLETAGSGGAVSRPTWRGSRASSRSRVRRALAGLMARGLVTNDRFDPVAPAQSPPSWP